MSNTITKYLKWCYFITGSDFKFSIFYLDDEKFWNFMLIFYNYISGSVFNNVELVTEFIYLLFRDGMGS
jgi:hypothetical protein